jgi:hypothetical protein
MNKLNSLASRQDVLIGAGSKEDDDIIGYQK